MDMMRSQVSKAINIRNVKGMHPPIIKVDLHNQIPCSQKAFLENSKNRGKFIELLSKHLANDRHDIQNNNDNVDTLIASTATEYTKKQDK